MPNPEGYLLVDIKKCQGCLSCMLACSLVHTGEMNLSASGIQVSQNSFEKFPDDIKVEITEKCDLCKNAPFWNEPTGPEGKLACVTICPLGAVRFFKELPSEGANGRQNVNFRGGNVWRKMGYPVD